MKKNIFILLLITTILCLSSCSGFLNDLVGFTEGSQNSWNGSNSNSSSITATVYNFTTSTGDDTYHIITWNTIGTASYYVIYGMEGYNKSSVLKHPKIQLKEQKDETV
jgi:hypothetical protein